MFWLYFLQAGKWIDHSLADWYTFIYYFHIVHYFFSLPDFFWTQFLIVCTSWFSSCCVSTIINYFKGELFYLWKIFGVGAVLVQRWPRCVEASKSKAGTHSRRRKRNALNQGETHSQLFHEIFSPKLDWAFGNGLQGHCARSWQNQHCIVLTFISLIKFCVPSPRSRPCLIGTLNFESFSKFLKVCKKLEPELLFLTRSQSKRVSLGFTLILRLHKVSPPNHKVFRNTI